MEQEIKLLKRVEEIHQTFKKSNDTIGQEFNIFSFLRKENDEVGVHSKFIAYLLDTTETHECGTIFLDLFLKTFKIENYDSTGSRSFVEHYIGAISANNSQGGAIDILLMNKTRQVIKIENKIDAGEQHKQLLRYHNYDLKGPLLFLTKTGKNSQDHDELKNMGIKYQTCSYNKEVIAWLELCLLENTPFYVSQIIHHYKNLILKITNQNSNSKMNNDIAESVISSESNFEAYKKIVGADAKIRAMIMKKFILPKLHRIGKQNNLSIKYDENEFCHTQPRYMMFWYSNKELKNKNICIGFQFDNSNARGLYFGFYQNGDKFDSENLANIDPQIRQNFQEKFGASDQGPDWLCYSFENSLGYYDWSNLDTLHKMAFGSFEDDLTILIGQLLLMLQTND